MLIFILIFGFTVTLFLGLISFLNRNPLAKAIASSEGAAKGERGLLARLTELFGSFVSALPSFIKSLITLPDLKETLKIAGWKIGAEDFLGIRVVASAALAMLAAIPFGRAWWLGAAIGAFIGYAVPVSLLARKVNSIGFSLQRATPLFLNLLVAGIRSGQSLEDAFIWAARIDDDLLSEIRRVMNDIKGGMTLQEALGELARRAGIMEAGELASACESISLAHRFGAGGISVALENVVRDMEARRGYMIAGRIKKLENIVTVPLVLSAMLAALASMAAPYLVMMYGGASSVF